MGGTSAVIWVKKVDPPSRKATARQN